jgi:hypothetical protein
MTQRPSRSGAILAPSRADITGKTPKSSVNSTSSVLLVSLRARSPRRRYIPQTLPDAAAASRSPRLGNLANRFGQSRCGAESAPALHERAVSTFRHRCPFRGLILCCAQSAPAPVGRVQVRPRAPGFRTKGDGFVSGIKAMAMATDMRPTAVMPNNPAVYPNL